ncbi:MAG: T9SS type A sorting domain-containing protein [Bacteroidota bacterium]
MKQTLLLFLFIANGLLNIQAQCWKAIAAGYSHTLAIKNDGTLWATGGITALGDGTTNSQTHFIQIGTDNNWESVSASVKSSYAIKTDGTLWVWGDNMYSQLGLGHESVTQSTYLTPTQVGNSTDWKTLCDQNAVAPGISTLVIKNNGTLWSLMVEPDQISEETNWERAANSFTQQYLIKNNGTLWVINSSSFTQIGTDSDWLQFSAGEEHCLALKTDGTLWGAFGSNNSGELGDGTIIPHSAFIKIGTYNNWKTIAAGRQNSFATKTDGTLWAWGRNDDGQLGLGFTGNQLFPVRVDNMNDWDSLIEGSANVFALKTDGRLFAWGTNNFGQLGLGSNDNIALPVNIPCNSVVPVIYSSFNTLKKNNGVLITWKTEMEQNKEYELQQSKDGIFFNTLVTIKSNTSNAGSSYQYLDQSPSVGLNYYRIKSIDQDGHFFYSVIRIINFDYNDVVVNILPNPVKDALIIKSNFTGKKLVVSVSDVTGKKIIQQSIINNPAVEIPVRKLKAGIYILTISDNKNTVTKKIVKE